MPWRVAGTRSLCGGYRSSHPPLGVVVHPRACVSPSAELASGCVVLAGAVVNYDALCCPFSQLGVNGAMAGEVLGCGESRFAELELTPGAADLSEGVSSAGVSG